MAITEVDDLGQEVASSGCFENGIDNNHLPAMDCGSQVHCTVTCSEYLSGDDFRPAGVCDEDIMSGLNESACKVAAEPAKRGMTSSDTNALPS